MALGDSFTQIKTDIANWLKRDDLTSAIPDFLTLAENRLARELRIRPMETALSSTISNGVIAVPSGYQALKYAYVDGNPVQWLERKDAEWIYANYPTRAAQSKPAYIAREADNFIFGPYPDSTYTIKGVYYKKLDALSVSNTTNWFTANAPDLLLFASLCEAEPYLMNDSRTVLWEQKYAAIRDRVQRENDSEEFSGSPIAATLR